jgi:hypothetical protein
LAALLQEIECLLARLWEVASALPSPLVQPRAQNWGLAHFTAVLLQEKLPRLA